MPRLPGFQRPVPVDIHSRGHGPDIKAELAAARGIGRLGSVDQGGALQIFKMQG